MVKFVYFLDKTINWVGYVPSVIATFCRINQQENLWLVKDSPYKLKLVCEPLVLPNSPTALKWSILKMLCIS